MRDLAEDSSDLFFTKALRNKIGNLNINEDMTDEEAKKIVKSNKRARQRYIAFLEIPTYGNFKYVYFYDTLQMMTQTIVSYSYDQEKIKEKKAALNFIGRIKGQKADFMRSSTNQNIDVMEAMESVGYKENYGDDFEDFLSGFGKMDKRIDKFNELKK